MVYLIGHSNYGIEVFVQWLQQYGVKRLIDARTSPYSRFCPQYNQTTLSNTLRAYGIRYDFRGANIGGKGENVNFRETLDEIALIEKSEIVAIMCVERDPLKCHRTTVIQPELEVRGVITEHITYR